MPKYVTEQVARICWHSGTITIKTKYDFNYRNRKVGSGPRKGKIRFSRWKQAKALIEFSNVVALRTHNIYIEGRIMGVPVGYNTRRLLETRVCNHSPSRSEAYVMVLSIFVYKYIHIYWFDIGTVFTTDWGRKRCVSLARVRAIFSHLFFYPFTHRAVQANERAIAYSKGERLKLQ